MALSEEQAMLKEMSEKSVEGLSERALEAIQQLAEDDNGAAIFLFVSMNHRIRELEKHIASMQGSFGGFTAEFH